MSDSRTIDNTYVFTKDVFLLAYWDSKVYMGKFQFYEKFNDGDL